MKRRYNILNIALLLGSAMFFCGLSAWSQSDKNVIKLEKGAENIRMDAHENFIITGNVVFSREDNTFLYCDSAHYNKDKEFVKAFGNIHLNRQDTLNMFCDSMYFDNRREYAQLFGNVRLRDDEYKLLTDSLDYDIKNNKAIYKNKGVITSINSSDYLESVIGHFYPHDEIFHFQKDVIFKNDEYFIQTDTLQFNGKSKIAYFFGPTTIESDSSTIYCESGWFNSNKEEGVFENNARIQRQEHIVQADSIYFAAHDSLYIAKNNVAIFDTLQALEINGDYAIYNQRARVNFVTGHALAKKYDEKDTLYLHADTLFNITDSLHALYQIQAYYNVKFLKGEFRGVCDSLVYEKSKGEMNFYHSPTLWAQNAQLSSDTITLYEKDEQPDYAYLRKQGLITSHIDSTHYYNQVAGTEMFVYFDSSNVKRIDLDGNAKTIAFMEEENENDTVIFVDRKGMNRLYGSSISILFDEQGEISQAIFRENPDGVMYPMDDIEKKEERVEYFKWVEELRPLSWQEMIATPEEKEFAQFLFHVATFPFGVSIVEEEKDNKEE